MQFFLHQPLTWAFLAVLAPLLIHLINMMRHRRVKWAAMEFLMASYKKHRKWIWLKQFFLLLLRMAAVAAVVAIMAKFVPPDQWAKIFGGRVTHHYVLLDDSFSMSDRSAGESAFDRAKQVVGRIAEQAAAQDTRQKLTLIRFSRSAQNGSDASASQSVADVAGEIVDQGAFKESFDARRRALEPSELATGPEAALRVLGDLLDDDSDESRVAYLVSDFRARDWDNPTKLDEQLKKLEKSGAEVHLVDCVKSQRPNLAVTNIVAAEGTRSAGVPLMVEVTVKNFGPAQAENISLGITSYSYENFDPARHGEDPVAVKPFSTEQPAEIIKSLAAGDSVTRRVQVYFPTPGQHVVEALLPEDAVVTDNSRYCVVNVPEGEPVLVLDGQPERRNAYFLSAAFQPTVRDVGGGNSSPVRTGIQPTIEDLAKLRDITPEQLRRYQAVYLLNVPRLDDAAIEKLENYVREGGGVAFFLGDDVIPSHYNEKLHRGGEGIFPVSLGQRDLLIPEEDTEDRVPDFEVIEHPVLSIFGGGDATFRRGILVGPYFQASLPRAVDQSGKEKHSTATVLATLRDDAATPFIVEQPFGQGRVIVFNTTVAPLWNNWARGHGGAPSFVVTMLQLHAYLAAPLRADPVRPVGSVIELALSPEKYQPEVKCIVPAVSPIARKPLSKQAAVKGDDLVAAIGKTGADLLSGGETDHRGIYEIWAASKAGPLEVERYALNVDAEEGNLARRPPAELAQRMQAKFQYHEAEEIEYQVAGNAAGNWSEYILYALVVLLLLEQFVAYTASYHPALGSVR